MPLSHFTSTNDIQRIQKANWENVIFLMGLSIFSSKLNGHDFNRRDVQIAANRKLSVRIIQSWHRLIALWISLRDPTWPSFGHLGNPLKCARTNSGRYLIDRGSLDARARSLDFAIQSDLPITVREILANSAARLTNSWFIGPFLAASLRSINENLATVTCRPRSTAIFMTMTYRRLEILLLSMNSDKFRIVFFSKFIIICNWKLRMWIQKYLKLYNFKFVLEKNLFLICQSSRLGKDTYSQ